MVLWAADRFLWCAWQTFFGSIEYIDETTHSSYNFFSSIKIVGTTVLCGLWALKWAWHPAEANWRCARSSRIHTKTQKYRVIKYTDIIGRQIDINDNYEYFLNDENKVPHLENSLNSLANKLDQKFIIANQCFYHILTNQFVKC